MKKQKLAVKREVHLVATIDRSLSKIKGTIFRKLDANSWFWKIPLDKEAG